ncbi:MULTISPECIES: phage tail assembly protein [unclassified Endozoicomonas]|uniref:phage tail assembly protein n=1 Tax=unclassified Endozoicomonas TaxID=2644528 RepID=UPI003BB7A3AE
MTAVAYTLKHPVVVGETHVTELTFQRPKAKHMKGIRLGNEIGMDDILLLAGRIAGQSSLVMDELDIEDVMAVAEVISGFLPAGDVTGPTGSE